MKQPPQHSREAYHQLLEAPTRTDDFYTRIALILNRDPYFFPGYLEMLWRAEEVGDSESHTRTLLYAYKVARYFLSQDQVKKDTQQHWTEFEKSSLLQILTIVANEKVLGVYTRGTAKMYTILCEKTIMPKTIASPVEPRRLQLIETVDHKPLQEEIKKMAPFWWLLDVGRAQNITHHKDTRAVIVRNLCEQLETYKPCDGVHESRSTTASSVLSAVHTTVLDFAERHKLGLARVVAVELKPFAQAYRHFDSEPFLRGRKRYHLVIQAGENNLLSAGKETIYAKPGEIWFFDNDVMHRAYNGSSVPRTHVIFDGYPLDA